MMYLPKPDVRGVKLEKMLRMLMSGTAMQCELDG